MTMTIHIPTDIHAYARKLRRTDRDLATVHAAGLVLGIEPVLLTEEDVNERYGECDSYEEEEVEEAKHWIIKMSVSDAEDFLRGIMIDRVVTK